MIASADHPGRSVVESGRRIRDYQPVMTIEEAHARFRAMAEFVRGVMREGADYGVIPGAGSKPVLLKPGAEKLCTLFGLVIPDPVILTEVEDWTGASHGGEPFFYYKVLQRLQRDGEVIASQFGSCNSRETKYRWRQSERLCPACGKPSIIRGKAEYGGGYVCFAKKGGCNAKFQQGDPAIEGQAVGRVANPDVCDLVNTILKMSQKRALIAATLLAVNASEFFTQDLEDLAEHELATALPAEPTPPPKERRHSSANQQAQQPPAPQQSQPEPAKQRLEEAFPTQPPTPGAMFLNLERKDADLAAQKLCKPGELIAHLRAAAEEAGHVEVELWSGPVMRRFAAEQVERFETGARRERVARQKTQGRPQTNGTASQAPSTNPISQQQVSILASTCAEKGTHFREVATMLGLNPETDIATLTPGLWQRAMDVALQLDERKESPPPKEEGQEAEDDERHVRTEDEVSI